MQTAVVFVVVLMRSPNIGGRPLFVVTTATPEYQTPHILELHVQILQNVQETAMNTFSSEC
jgi:hypothetical protein